MARAPRNRGDLLAKGVQVLKGLAPHSRRHLRLFVLGAVGACCTVAARLALPWPLRAVAQRWMDPAEGAVSGVPTVFDPVLTMGLLFLALILLLGFSDYSARLYFARFAIGTVRDLRGSVFRSVVRGSARRRAKRPGDLVSRLVGDTARIKAGLQGFLLHVGTNGLTLVGATAIVFWMNPELGFVFAVAVVATLIISALTAVKVFRKSLKVRKKEGQLADKIQSTVASKKSGRSAVKKLNRSSGRHEASLTHLQGVATWITHGTFGMAMLAALWIGSRAVNNGELPAADMVVVMMYALTMRGPIVRLARQGARTGRFLGPAHRLIQLQNKFQETQTVNTVQEPTRPNVNNGSVRVLFSGHAPVHFACFQPLYARLCAHPDVEVFVSGGLRSRRKDASEVGGKKKKKRWQYDGRALYEPFGVPPDQVLPVNEMRGQDFDVVF
ncbi:MAG: ABC transporter transmembrane domain-containing protein, partial [Myxococcota bacterium]